MLISSGNLQDGFQADLSGAIPWRLTHFGAPARNWGSQALRAHQIINWYKRLGGAGAVFGTHPEHPYDMSDCKFHNHLDILRPLENASMKPWVCSCCLFLAEGCSVRLALSGTRWSSRASMSQPAARVARAARRWSHAACMAKPFTWAAASLRPASPRARAWSMATWCSLLEIGDEKRSKGGKETGKTQE